MLEILLYSGICGLAMALMGSFLFHCLEFGNIFWKLKYKIGLFYTRNDPEPNKLLRNVIQQALEAKYDQQYDIAMAGYKAVAAKHYMFTRWICPMCFSGFISSVLTVLFMAYLVFEGNGIPLVIMSGVFAFLCSYLFTKVIMLLEK